MGQAFRRATGRIAGSTLETTSQLSKPIERRAPTHPPPAAYVDKAPRREVASEETSRVNLENVLEVRDPKYDNMLSQMAGRIRAKPGSKLEMGEAVVVDKYKRPLPKLRNTRPDSDRYEERPAPPGTLNVKQVRQVVLLFQGKSDEHQGPMDISQIAQRFQIDVAQVQSIVSFVALSQQNSNKGQA